MSKREKRYRDWVFTTNNPRGPPSLLVHFFRSIGATFIFQLEEGENGTPHWQGTFRLKYKKGFTALKKLFDVPAKGSHLERCKAWEESTAYCQKADGRLAGPWSDGVPVIKAPVDTYKKSLEKEWQRAVLSLLQTEPDLRAVHWYYESTGGVGKSILARHIVGFAQAGRAIVVNGSARDIYHRVLSFSETNGPPSVVLIDIPRCNRGGVSYQAIESLKSGLIASSKYEGGQLVFDSPHVIVFSNDPPSWGQLSADRWHVYEIQPNGTASPRSPVVEDVGGFLAYDAIQ